MSADSGLRAALERLLAEYGIGSAPHRDISRLLAEHPVPDPVPTPAPADLYHAVRQWWEQALCGVADPSLDDVLARFAPVELPEGSIPLAPGWHLRRSEEDPDEFELWPPITFTFVAARSGGEWSAVGQPVPVPEPAPEITVGCIVRTEEGHEASVEVIAHGFAFLFDYHGGWIGSWAVSSLSFAAPSRDAAGWPPIQEER